MFYFKLLQHWWTQKPVYLSFNDGENLWCIIKSLNFGYACLEYSSHPGSDNYLDTWVRTSTITGISNYMYKYTVARLNTLVNYSGGEDNGEAVEAHN